MVWPYGEARKPYGRLHHARPGRIHRHRRDAAPDGRHRQSPPERNLRRRRQAPARLRPGGEPDPRGMAVRHPVPDRSRPEMQPLRQEFILLSDVLGLSAVVNALHDKKARELGSQSSLLGPFYREGVAVHADGRPDRRKTDGRGDRRLRQGHRQRRRPIGQCADPDLADQRARTVRPAGAQRRVHGHARQLPDRRRRHLPFPHRPAAGLLDPDGRPGRRDGACSRNATACGRHTSIA